MALALIGTWAAKGARHYGVCVQRLLIQRPLLPERFSKRWWDPLHRLPAQLLSGAACPWPAATVLENGLGRLITSVESTSAPSTPRRDGRHAAQLCKICMEFSGELRCSGSGFTANSCIRRQSEVIAHTGMDRALEGTATNRPGPQLGPCKQSSLAGSARLETPERLGFQVDLAKENNVTNVTNVTWIKDH